MRPVLYVGNKNYSSWSLRPWLALRWGYIAFDEVLIPLGGDGYGSGKIAGITAVSPSGRLPVLHVASTAIFESLAIIEWAAEQPGSGLWPVDPAQRAVARSLAAEMHAGFGALRRDLTMNLRRRRAEPKWPEDTRADLAKVSALFERALAASGGPWLMGRRGAVDAMFAPVLTRLRTYSVPVSEPIAALSQRLFDDPDFQDWERAALAEPMRIASADALWP